MLCELALTLARVVMIVCAAAWAFMLKGEFDYFIAMAVYLPFRLLVLCPVSLYKYSSGGALAAFRVMGSIRLYMRAMLTLIIRIICCAVILSPLCGLYFITVLPEIYTPFIISAALILVFTLWVIYQYTFAVPVMLSQDHTVWAAYKASFKLIHGHLGDVLLFYLKRFYCVLLKLSVLPWIFLCPFYYKAKSALPERITDDIENPILQQVAAE